MNRVLVTSFVALFVLVIAGTTMFWKSKSTNTLLAKQEFRLTLPGKWAEEPSPDPTRWTYHDENHREQLTIAIMGDTHAMSRDELSSTFKRLVEMRRDVEMKVPGVTGVTVSEPTFAESKKGTFAARYQGSQPSAQRRFHCLILGSRWTFTFFYYEAADMSEAESEARAKEIFNSISVPE